LTSLAGAAPGLAPAPLRAQLDRDPATVEMSWLPGAALGGAPLTSRQTAAMAAALERLWRVAPSDHLRSPAISTPNAVAFARQVQRMLATGPAPGEDPVVRLAWDQAAGWLGRGTMARGHERARPAVLGQGDPNLANFLWDGERVRLVDFEDSGPSDRAFELAILVEHVSAWTDAGLDAEAFLASFGLTAAEHARVAEVRRLAALFWLIMLRPGGPASARNPPGTQRRQARRLLALLG
jgi:aminoglycoside phosphotransferase (APT) family kinase protein